MSSGPSIPRAAVALLLLVGLWACGPSSEGDERTPEDETTGTEATGRTAAPTDGSPERSGATSAGDLPPGRWRLAPRSDEAELTDEQQAQMEELARLGYTDGVQAGSGRVGVTVHERGRVGEGVNLYVSGHATEAYVTDMDGRVLHRWSLSFDEAFPGRGIDDRVANKHFWRRVAVDDEGRLFAIHDGMGLVKVDRDSRLLWSLAEPVHHDLEVLADGTVLTLTRRPQVVPRWDAERPLLLGYVATVSSDGELIDELPLLEAFERSEYAELFATRVAEHQRLADRWEVQRQGLARPWGDLFHDNTLERLDGSLAHLYPAFAEGHLLLSFRSLDLLAIVDPASERVVWAAVGPWRHQHQPTLLDDGSMLVFDNAAGPGRSSVVQFDPLTGDVLWAYGPEGDEAFHSSALGSVQRLPDGHTLITESHAGRAFEVTPDGTIVWEFHSPHRAGPDGGYVANLFEVVRLPPSAVEGWLR